MASSRRYASSGLPLTRLVMVPPRAGSAASVSVGIFHGSGADGPMLASTSEIMTLLACPVRTSDGPAYGPDAWLGTARPGVSRNVMSSGPAAVMVVQVRV